MCVLIQNPLEYLDHGCATFSGKGPQPLLWAGLQAVNVKITKCGFFFLFIM